MPDFTKPLHDGRDSQWLRPRTLCRYLHAPKAERMFTLWAEGKIVFGEIEKGVDWRSYPELDCSAIWLTHTKYARPFDFRKTQNSLYDKSIPVHTIENGFGGFTVKTEAFCDTERKCSCFIKISIKNNAPYFAKDKIGLVVRSGKEKKLVHGSPDEYISYMPEISEFKHEKTTFTEENGVLFDKERDVFITYDTSLPTSFDSENGILWAEIGLDSNQSAEIVLSFGKGKVISEFNYEAEKAKTVSFWKNELARISNIPEGIKTDDELLDALYGGVVQLLQCFCYYKGTDELVLRQGGLQRLIWPWEAMPAIDALSQLGDFADYIEPVLSLYFDVMHRENGEISNVGEGWASVTSSALRTFVKYCAQTNNKALWEKYRAKALKTFEWIKNKRHESDDMDDAVSGLYPPMRGSDWPQVLQHWTVTDCFALEALLQMADTMKKFGDTDTDRVVAEYEEYKSVIRSLYKKFTSTDSDEIRIPLTAMGDDAAMLNDFYPYLHMPMPLVMLRHEIDAKDLHRLYKYATRVGFTQNGLYGRMPYKDGNTHIWYTNNPDYDWFVLWNHFGEREKAKEIIDAQIKYSMTDEYYMLERYADNDPYYVPWSPNVSAIGRFFNMLLEFYK